MASLENLKKQAKQILRWHRERHFPVAALIRSHLPCHRELSDASILAAPFKLADAQEVVARRNGFESWQALKTGLSTMTTALPQTEAKPILAVALPCVFVSDIKASCAFFTEKLGFTVAFTYGDPPYFAEVVRDGARLNLRRVGAAPIDPRLRDEEELLAASFGVETDAEIKVLFLEFQSAGVEFYERLAKQPWGVRAFIARDLDGNLLAFAGPPTDAA